MAIQRNSRVLRSLRQAQEVANNGAAGTPNAAMGTPDAPKPIEMSFLSNATSFVDDKGVGHVKVNNGVDWSNILPRDSTVHISYGGSGSNKEILVVPIDNKTSDSPPKDVAPGKSSPNMANHLPEGSGSVGTIEWQCTAEGFDVERIPKTRAVRTRRSLWARCLTNLLRHQVRWTRT
uniref:Uncharacterized protein n=1 Tax=Hyaloperonospora arabidopsidis (strain Emoy2) TaxID=559515 RepID=M4B8Z5_HYAAE